MQTPAERTDQGTSAQGSSSTSQTAANTGGVLPKGILKQRSQVSTDQNVVPELEEAVSRPKKDPQRVRIAEQDNQLRPYDPYGPPSSSHIFLPTSATSQGKDGLEERSDSASSTSSDTSSPPRRMGNTTSKIPLFAPKSPSGSPEPEETQQTLSASREDTPFSPAKPAVQVPFYERQPRTPISRTYGKSSKPSSSGASSKTVSAGPSPRKAVEKGKQREEEAEPEVPAEPPYIPKRVKPVPTVAAKAAARDAAKCGASTSSSKAPFPVIEHASGSPELPEIPPRRTPASSRPRAVSKPEVTPSASAKSSSSKKPLSLDSSTPSNKRKFDDSGKPKSEGKRNPVFVQRKNAASTISSARTSPAPSLRAPGRSAKSSAPSSSDKAERSKYREDSVSSSDEFEEHSTASRANKRRRKTESEDDTEYKPPSSSSVKNTPKKSIRTRRDSQHEEEDQDEVALGEKYERNKPTSARSTPRKAKKPILRESAQKAPDDEEGNSARKANNDVLFRTLSEDDFLSDRKSSLRATTLAKTHPELEVKSKPASNYIYTSQNITSAIRGKSVEPVSSKSPLSSSRKPKSADSFMSKMSSFSTPAKKRRIVEDESDSDAFEVTPTKATPSAPASTKEKGDAASVASSTTLRDNRMEHVESSITAVAAVEPIVAPDPISGGTEPVLPPEETAASLQSSSSTLPRERNEEEQPMLDNQTDVIEISATSFEDDDLDLGNEAMPAVEEAMAMTEVLQSSSAVEATDSTGEERMEAEEDVSPAAQALLDGTPEVVDQAMQYAITIADDQPENKLADRAMPSSNGLNVSVDVANSTEPASKVSDMAEITAENNEEASPNIAKRTLDSEGDMAEDFVTTSVQAAKLQEVEETVRNEATEAEFNTEKGEPTLIDTSSDVLAHSNDVQGSVSEPAYERLPSSGPVRTPRRKSSNVKPYPAMTVKLNQAGENARESSVEAKPVSTGKQSGYEASISSRRLESAEPIEGNEAMGKQYNMPKQIHPDAEDVLHGKDSSASPDKKPDPLLLGREPLSKGQRQCKAESWMQKQSDLDASDYVDPADGTRSRRPSSSAALTSYGSDMSAVPDSEVSEAEHIDNSRFDVLQDAIDHRLSGKPLQAEDAGAAMQDVETVLPVTSEEHTPSVIPSDSMAVEANMPEETQVQSPAFSPEPNTAQHTSPAEMQRSSPDRILQPTFIVATNDGTSTITCPSCSHLDELHAFGVCYVEPGPAVFMPASRRDTATYAKEEAAQKPNLLSEKAPLTTVDSKLPPNTAASSRSTGGSSLTDEQGIATEEPALAGEPVESEPDLSGAVKSESSEVVEGIAHSTAEDSMDMQVGRPGSLLTAASTNSLKVVGLTFANTGTGASTKSSSSTMTAQRKQNLDKRRQIALQLNKSTKRMIRQSPQLPNQGSGSNLSLDSNVSLEPQSDKPDSSSRRSAKRVFNEMEAWNKNSSLSADLAAYEIKQIELPSSPKPRRKQATLPKRGQEKLQGSKGSSRKSATMPAIPESPIDENRGQGAAAAAVQRIAASTSRRTAVAKLLPVDEAQTAGNKNRLEPSQRMKPAFLAAVFNQDKPKDIPESSSNVSEDQIVEKASAPVSTSKGSRRSIPQESQ